MTPEEMVARLLYRDGLMLVIDKPAGFAVHRGPKGGESLEDHFDALRFGLPRAPVARPPARPRYLRLPGARPPPQGAGPAGKLFKAGRIGKTYWAVVEGGPEADEGRIDMPLGRLDETRGWWMKPDPDGQPAVTTWKVMGRSRPFPAQPVPARRQEAIVTGGASSVPSPHRAGRASDATRWGEGAGPLLGSEGASPPASTMHTPHLAWLALEPVTGPHPSAPRPLRRHGLADRGRRDLRQRAPRTGGTALQLHSREIVVPLSKNKAPVSVTAPVPEHMREWLMACGWNACSPDEAKRNPGTSS